MKKLFNLWQYQFNISFVFYGQFLRVLSPPYRWGGVVRRWTRRLGACGIRWRRCATSRRFAGDLVLLAAGCTGWLRTGTFLQWCSRRHFVPLAKRHLAVRPLISLYLWYPAADPAYEARCSFLCISWYFLPFRDSQRILVFQIDASISWKRLAHPHTCLDLAQRFSCMVLGFSVVLKVHIQNHSLFRLSQGSNRSGRSSFGQLGSSCRTRSHTLLEEGLCPRLWGFHWGCDWPRLMRWNGPSIGALSRRIRPHTNTSSSSKFDRWSPVIP